MFNPEKDQLATEAMERWHDFEQAFRRLTSSFPVTGPSQ
jgi:hypothetical protein